MARKYRLTTLGCKVNQYESQQIRETLESLGLRAARRGEIPDVAIVNTCAVTTSAASKTRQSIRRLCRGGSVPTIVVGCYAAAAPEAVRGIPGVLAAIGHDRDVCREVQHVVEHRLASVPGPPGLDEHISAAAAGTINAGDRIRDDVWLSSTARVADRTTDRPAREPPAIPSIPTLPAHVNDEAQFSRTIRAFDGHQRAFLKVQDGCDAFCTYCIIPHLRPGLGWKPVDVAVREAHALVAAGHREIVITGIYLGAYGRQTAVRRRYGHDASPLAELVEALAGVRGLERLRLSSLEPGDVDDRLLAVLRRHDACVPHLHLPLQAGSDAVLHRMNRQYTAADFLDMAARVKEALDRPAITTDIVIGFPGETEADFEQTLDIARRVGFCKIHAFPFSPRPGTPAGRWSARFVAPDAVKQRIKRLAEVERESSEKYLTGLIGSVERVIVERPLAPAPARAGSLRHGRTDRYFEVFFDAPAVHGGDVVRVRIDRVTPGRVHGSLINVLRGKNGIPDRKVYFDGRPG